MIIAFAFLKVSLEKSKPPKGKVNIVNNISITDAKKGALQAGDTKGSAMNIYFSYVTKYDPDFATITLEGTLLYNADDKKIAEIDKMWKDSQKLPDDVKAVVMNSIIERSTVKSLMLADNFNLPPSINLPKVQLKEDAKK